MLLALQSFEFEVKFENKQLCLKNEMLNNVLCKNNKV